MVALQAVSLPGNTSIMEKSWQSQVQENIYIQCLARASSSESALTGAKIDAML